MSTTVSKSRLLAVCAFVLFASAPFAAGPFVDDSRRIDFRRGAIGLTSEGLGGAAWLDHDGDGDLDLFLPNRPGRLNALYRNDGDGRFTDVAIAAGVANGLGNKGALAGDIDNDGCVDLFLTGEGAMVGPVESPARLYVNRCDGTFLDATAGSGIAGPIPGLMGAFGDIDNDGFIDLFISSPGSFFTGRQTRNKLYRNNGDRTFTDISASAGVDTALGGCAVMFHDHDEDGWIDIFLGNCNDLDVEPTPFELFRNDGDLTFTDVANEAGLGQPGFWMGLSFGDVDGDLDLDLFSTSGGISMPGNPYHGLFRRNADNTYTDVAVAAGVAAWEFGWGGELADFDNDGDVDLLFTGSFPPFGMLGPGSGNPGRLFVNDGTGVFSMAADFGLENRYSSGLAVADYDADGSADVVIVVSRLLWPRRSPLLRNKGNANHWITVRPVGTVSNRQGIGARIVVTDDGGRSQIRLVSAGSSFLSTSSPWPTFGLDGARPSRVEVRWPSGLTEVFEPVPTDAAVTVIEGSGAPPAPLPSANGTAAAVGGQ